MKNITLLIILLLAFGCSNTNEQKNNQIEDTLELTELPEISDVLSEPFRQSSRNKRVLTSSAQFSPSTTVKCNGIYFDLAWDKAGRVTYIMTKDTNFVTKDMVRVNMTLNEIKDLNLDEIQTMPGWAYYFEMKTGWSAAICVETDNGCTGREISETDTIKWLFKR